MLHDSSQKAKLIPQEVLKLVYNHFMIELKNLSNARIIRI